VERAGKSPQLAGWKACPVTASHSPGWEGQRLRPLGVGDRQSTRHEFPRYISILLVETQSASNIGSVARHENMGLRLILVNPQTALTDEARHPGLRSRRYSENARW
jgi:hypothetical protein